MTLHVVGLPHTQLTEDYSACAYTQKVRRFARMMNKQGYSVAMHGLLDADTRASFGFHGPDDYLKINFDPTEPIWQYANAQATKAIRASAEPGDVVCLIGGTAQQPLVDIVPGVRTVEFGIGYEGVCTGTFKVFESYAWRHYVYGMTHSDGNYFDEVIPNGYEVDRFPVVAKPSEYVAFVGRIIDRKGYRVAQDVCQRLDVPLKIAGAGGPPDGYGEYLGVLDAHDTINLMANATCVMVPTQYVGPFEGVHVEAMLCGTPVVVPDFGVFVETVVDNELGERCRMFKDYVHGVQRALAGDFERRWIAHRAREEWCTEMAAVRYEMYFERLATLDGDGWYAQ